jgi:hypothetical protein
MARLVNIWLILRNDYALEMTGATAPLRVLPKLHQAVLKRPARGVQERYFPHATRKLFNVYIRYDELFELVPIRENIQGLEDRFPDKILCGGFWDFDTGTPIGGVGAPWFVTDDLVKEFIPEQLDPGGEVQFPAGVLRDQLVLAGQAARKFI